MTTNQGSAVGEMGKIRVEATGTVSNPVFGDHIAELDDVTCTSAGSVTDAVERAPKVVEPRLPYQAMRRTIVEISDSIGCRIPVREGNTPSVLIAVAAEFSKTVRDVVANRVKSRAYFDAGTALLLANDDDIEQAHVRAVRSLMRNPAPMTAWADFHGAALALQGEAIYLRSNGNFAVLMAHAFSYDTASARQLPWQISMTPAGMTILTGNPSGNSGNPSTTHAKTKEGATMALVSMVEKFASLLPGSFKSADGGA